MKKSIILISLCMIFLLSSCSKKINNTEFEKESYEFSSKKMEFTEQISEYTQIQTDYFESSSGRYEEPNEISNYMTAIEDLSIYSDGMLYDFDFDSIPEIIIFDYGMNDTFYNIYKYIDGKFMYLGEIKNCDEISHCPEKNLAHIDMYYDKVAEEYFYCSNAIEFLKNNADLRNDYGFYYGNLYKYVFTSKNINSSTILNIMINFDDYDDSIQNYMQECENYLNQFDSIHCVFFEPLWDIKNINNGTYKDIIKHELENNYIVK